MTSEPPPPAPCRAYTARPALPLEVSMALQPVVDQRSRACQALLRGTNGSGAAAILAQLTAQNRYQFDKACRVKAVELAFPRRTALYLFQGYPLTRPAYEQIPEADWSKVPHE